MAILLTRVVEGGVVQRGVEKGPARQPGGTLKVSSHLGGEGGGDGGGGLGPLAGGAGWGAAGAGMGSAAGLPLGDDGTAGGEGGRGAGPGVGAGAGTGAGVGTACEELELAAGEGAGVGVVVADEGEGEMAGSPVRDEGDGDGGEDPSMPLSRSFRIAWTVEKLEVLAAPGAAPDPDRDGCAAIPVAARSARQTTRNALCEPKVGIACSEGSEIGKHARASAQGRSGQRTPRCNGNRTSPWLLAQTYCRDGRGGGLQNRKQVQWTRRVCAEE